MKRNRLFILAAMLPALATLQAQTSYEAAELLSTDLSGTARFVGMGGAMGALGADISTMGTNPAGTALFRSYDFSVSMGGNWVTQRTQSNIGRNRSFSSYGSFENIGIVMANKLSNDDGKNAGVFCLQRAGGGASRRESPVILVPEFSA